MLKHYLALLFLFVCSVNVSAQTLPWSTRIGQMNMYVAVHDFSDNEARCSLDDVADAAAQVATVFAKASFGQFIINPIILNDPSRQNGHLYYSEVDSSGETAHPTCRLVRTSGMTFDSFVYSWMQAHLGIDLDNQDARLADNWRIIHAQSCVAHGSSGLTEKPRIFEYLGQVYTEMRTSFSATIGRCTDARLMAHEFGHTLGMAHGSGYRAQVPTIDTYGQVGTPGEYNDSNDFMGQAPIIAGLNAVHRIQMGWIPPSKILNGSIGNNVFTLHDLETVTSDNFHLHDNLALKVSRDPAKAASQFLPDFDFVSLRDGTIYVHGLEINPTDAESPEVNVWGNSNRLLRFRGNSGVRAIRGRDYKIQVQSKGNDEASILVLRK